MAASRKTDNNLYHTEMESPLGRLILGEHDGRICLVEYKSGKRSANGLNTLADYYGANLSRRDTPALKTAKKQLNLYFTGKLSKFDLPMDYSGTGFQKRIWKQLEKIPYGETVSYGWVAGKVGNPRASRAAGAAVGSNRLSIVIPCHRVTGKDGALTGYGGGLKKKEWLLAHEKAI